MSNNNEISRFSILRERGGEWCKATIELLNRNGVLELSISGAAGLSMHEDEAREQAVAYWVSFFEEMPEEIISMNKRMGTDFGNAEDAAQFVLDTDGEFHGLDVEDTNGDIVLMGHSWGQITDDLAEWFPELRGLFRWHLNGMQAGCFHQALQGRTFKTDPGHECPACGTKLGNAWNVWPLPASVVARVEALRALA